MWLSGAGVGGGWLYPPVFFGGSGLGVFLVYFGTVQLLNSYCFARGVGGGGFRVFLGLLPVFGGGFHGLLVLSILFLHFAFDKELSTYCSAFEHVYESSLI